MYASSHYPYDSTSLWKARPRVRECHQYLRRGRRDGPGVVSLCSDVQPQLLSQYPGLVERFQGQYNTILLRISFASQRLKVTFGGRMLRDTDALRCSHKLNSIRLLNAVFRVTIPAGSPMIVYVVATSSHDHAANVRDMYSTRMVQR